MTVLNDKQIRSALIDRIDSMYIKPKAIIEELRVNDGNAIADVVALYREAHCFEIKGDGDKIERIVVQGSFYNLSFRKITLVTTVKHLSKALELAPEFWGIIVAQYDNSRVLLKYVRKSQHNPDFDKTVALKVLWKNEMLKLLPSSDSRNKRKSRDCLTELIAKNRKRVELSYQISLSLLSRYNHV